MASKALFAFFLFFVTIAPSLSRPISSSSFDKKPSPFEFLKHLQGCHKGDNLKGIHDLKKYLQRFGYLDNHKSLDDKFDDRLEAALKTYQLNHHLNVTGDLNAQTVSEMMLPRCGDPDIVNGTTRMLSGKKSHHHNFVHTVSHYTFFPGSPTWRASKSHLTYSFKPDTPVEFVNPIARAFDKWASVSHFTFSQTRDYNNADLKIGFERGDHGDGFPFDGPQGTIAHAFQPEDGRFHYDGDESWTVGAQPRAFDVETVALHEIGHLLGLHHSSEPTAIMYYRIPVGAVKDLHADDIQGIRDLYNLQ